MTAEEFEGIDARLWAVALHESAHSVVYLAAGHHVVHTFVGRCSDGRTYGCTKAFTKGYAPLLRAVASLAGPISEQSHTGQPWAKLAQDSARDDLANAEAALAMLGARRPCLDEVVALARAAVERNRINISIVARKLAERRYLTGYEVTGILAGLTDPLFAADLGSPLPFFPRQQLGHGRG